MRAATDPDTIAFTVNRVMTDVISVIAGEEDDGIFSKVQLIELLKKPAEVAVDGVDAGVILAVQSFVTASPR